MNSDVNDVEQSIELTEINNTNNPTNDKKPPGLNITMEPIWLGTITSLTMSFSAFQNLLLERACTVDLGYSFEACFQSNESMKRQIEIDSQQVVTSLSVESNIAGYFLTFLVLLFLGPWSDLSGRRKLFILLPIFGMIVASIGLLALQVFPNAFTVWALYIKVLPFSISGSDKMLMMATFKYLGDICFKTGRCKTTVMRCNSAVISASIIIGSLLAPVLLRNFKFVGVFIMSVILELSALLYGFCKIDDFHIDDEVPNIFSFKLSLQAFKCLFKKRKGHKRRNVLLMALVPCTSSIIFTTETILLYLYLRHQFQWTEVEYGIFSAYREITQFIGTTIILNVLKHNLKLNDKTIGIIGSISQFISFSVYILSTKSWMIFLAPIFGIISRAVVIAEKAILNKQIPASEQGKLNSIAVVLDQLVAMFAIPIGYYMYSVSLIWMPNLFLFLSLITTTIQFFSYYYISTKPINDKIIVTK